MDLKTWLATPLAIEGEALQYEVEQGSHLRKVIQDLVSQGVLEKPEYFLAWVRWRDLPTNIKAGEYQIEPGTTPIAMLDKMVKGEVIQHALTLIEGWHYWQVLEAIRNQPKLKQTLPEGVGADLMRYLELGDLHPEGQFLPETYHFSASTSDVEFLLRAHQALEAILQAEWQERAEDLPYETPYEALIMASIVEKETAVAEERPEIAGVFVRRLQKGMRLQTDPTVIYGIGPSFSGNLRRKDLKQKTAYNTYVIKGLPPTPIAMVGRDAIHAALHPVKGKSLYFVARGDGTHHFSDTLAEHNRAVAKYQLRRRK